MKKIAISENENSIQGDAPANGATVYDAYAILATASREFAPII
jgi:hypothetical protein